MPLSLVRIQYTRRQTEATEQGLITDRINKAVEMLGAEKVVKIPGKQGKNDITVERSDPNTEVRIGAIYSLTRIAKGSFEDQEQTLRIFASYARMLVKRDCPVCAGYAGAGYCNGSFHRKRSFIWGVMPGETHLTRPTRSGADILQNSLLKAFQD